MGRLDLELDNDFAEYQRRKDHPENRDGGLTRQMERVANRNLVSSLRSVQIQLRAYRMDLQSTRALSDRTRIEKEIATLEAHELELSQEVEIAAAQTKKSAETLQTAPEVKTIQNSTKERALNPAPAKRGPKPGPRQAPKMPVLSKTEIEERRLRDYIATYAIAYVSLASAGLSRPERLTPFVKQVNALPEECRMKKDLQRILEALLANKKLDTGMALLRELRAL